MLKRCFVSIAKNPISVTNNAWNKMINIQNNQTCYSFLFSANSGGCNGFNYKLDLIDYQEYNEIINENVKIKPLLINNNNVKLLVDPKSEYLLFGTTIDYINEDYSNGIFENKFVFIPNKDLANTCGCGVSFTPKINKKNKL